MFVTGWWRHRPIARRISYLFVLIVLLWLMTNLNMFMFRADDNRIRSSQILRSEIIKLSEEYVQALAVENSGIIDGPYAGRFTGYDLKKTMAVLLDDMLTRLNRVEHTLGINGSHLSMKNITHNASVDNYLDQSHKKLFLSLKDVLTGKTLDCNLTDAEIEMYPLCLSKIKWMNGMWKSHACYSQNGVDGSKCSILRYLSEVESWCPSRPWRGKDIETTESIAQNATIRTDLNPLLSLLVDPNERHAYSFIRMRMTRMWNHWVAAIKSLSSKYGMEGRLVKKVLIHLGLLSKQTGWKFAENQFSGGPLGELVQWSDLIACLYILGHDITIMSEVYQLHVKLGKIPSANTPCQNLDRLSIDLIYTDIAGMLQMKKELKSGFAKFSCLLRIVDSFGTEPAFNHATYAKKHKIYSQWGGHNLNPLQFFTMFPHTPDNSFMGFVVEHLLPPNVTHGARKNQAVIYGKRDVFWEGKRNYLQVVSQKLELHATVVLEKGQKNVPAFVKNHGILSGPKLHQLLHESKVFIGLGFPYEGPAPLEAIANGAVFINPSFRVPHNRNNTLRLKGKPTFRNISSQHTYADKFIGKPFVYTIDIEKPDVVRKTIEQILARDEFPSYLPYEYTEEGMLQRMSVYIQQQMYCGYKRTKARWPPVHSVQMHLAPLFTDCVNSCSNKGLICEPTYFPDLNTEASFSKHSVRCRHSQTIGDIHAPAVDPRDSTCYLQADNLLFSCAGSKGNVRRLCPCRTFTQGQTALCDGCTH